MVRSTLVWLVACCGPLSGQATVDEFFGLDKIWDIHVVIERDAWIQLFPNDERAPTRMFGKFEYQKADVTIGEHRLRDVGFRMKGNATFMATAGTLKRSLKLDFDRYEEGQSFLGMGKLNLQCNALDGTQIKEAVSYSIFRACGVTAGRTAFARLWLTMKGEFEKTYIGLYTVVEQVDSRYAKRTVGDGLILKPTGETLGYFGETWNEDYERAYVPKTPVDDDLAEVVIRTASLFDEPSDEVFEEQIERFMDVESFLEFTAVTTILIHTDSPLTVPDNYYLIVPERTKKVTWIPWDMNWSMGEFGRVTRTPHVELSVMRPTEKEVFRRVLEIPRFRDRYRAMVEAFIEGPASADSMIVAMKTAHAAVASALAAEAERDAVVTDAPKELGGERSKRDMQPRAEDDLDGLLEFARLREASVLAQLAGDREGASARNLFGPNRREPRGTILFDAFVASGVFDERESFRADDLDAVSDASFRGLDADGTSRLDAEEVLHVLAARWDETRRRWRRQNRDEWARRVLARVDADSADGITVEEWRDALRPLFRYWDRDQDGVWRRDEMR